MSRRNNFIHLGVLALLGLGVLLSLLVPQPTPPDISRQPPELSVIIREPDSPLWFNCRQGMEQAAGELGAELRFIPLTGFNNVAEQVQMVRSEVENGSDLFVIASADSEVLGPQLNELTGQRTVVAMESTMEAAADYIGLDNQAVGEALARELLDHYQGGTVLLVNTAPQVQAVDQRAAAARRLLEEQGLSLEYRETPASLLSQSLSRMTSQTAARSVMVFEHTATLQAAKAKEADALTCTLYGVGASGSIPVYLERGTLRAVAAWSEYAIGYQAVTQALGIYDGSVTASGDDISFSIVNGEDIYDPEIQKLLFPVAS